MPVFGRCISFFGLIILPVCPCFAQEQVTNVAIAIKSATSSISYDLKSTPSRIVQAEAPTGAIPFQKFAVTIRNNTDTTIRCRLDFFGFEGRLGGYVHASDDLSALIDKQASRTVDQPQQLLITTPEAIQVRCFKFSF
jgi:hypothetical protein